MATKWCLCDFEHEAQGCAKWSNCVGTLIGRHLSVTDPNPFTYPIISCSCRFLDNICLNDMSYYNDNCPHGVPADVFMDLESRAIGMVLRDLELLFICMLPWQRDL